MSGLLICDYVVRVNTVAEDHIILLRNKCLEVFRLFCNIHIRIQHDYIRSLVNKSDLCAFLLNCFGQCYEVRTILGLHGNANLVLATFVVTLLRIFGIVGAFI